MNFEILLIGIIISLVFILPIYLFGRSRSKHKKVLKKTLHQLANSTDCKIHISDVWNDFVIGLDSEKRILFFYQKNKDNESSQIIKINEIQKVRISSFSIKNEDRDKGQNYIDQSGIIISFHSSGKKDVFLEFYNSKYGNFSIGPELQIAEKWVKIINSNIR